MAASKHFRGGVFCATLQGGRAGALIGVERDKLRAQTDSDDVFELLFTDIGLEVGGASGRMLFCRNPERTVTIFCEEPGFIFALTSCAGQHVTKQLAPVNRRLKWLNFLRAMGVVATVMACASLAWGLPKIVRWGLRTLVHRVPWQVDEQLGMAAMASADVRPSFSDPLVQQTLDAMVQRLSEHVAQPGPTFRVHVVRQHELNAFALPGGHVVVYTSLLAKARSPEQIAAVLAHEMGHVLQRHGLQHVARSIGIVAAVQMMMGDVGGILALGEQLLTLAAVNNYSRHDELQADSEAVDLLSVANIDPQALIDFFQLMQQSSPEKGQVAVPEWLQSHPGLQERIDAVGKHIAALPSHQWSKLAVDWPKVQSRLSVVP